MHIFSLRQRAQVFKPAQVREVDLARILALRSAAFFVRAGIEEETVGVAPQLGDRVQLERNNFIDVFLFRKVAVHAVICDLRRQAMALVTQLLFVEINSGLFLLLSARRLRIAWWRLCADERESAAARSEERRVGKECRS